MNEKFVNLMLFLADEIQHDVEKDLKNFNEQNKKLYQQIAQVLFYMNSNRINSKAKKAKEFLIKVKEIKNNLAQNTAISINESHEEFAVAFRRKSKTFKYEPTADDLLTLKAIKEIAEREMIKEIIQIDSERNSKKNI